MKKFIPLFLLLISFANTDKASSQESSYKEEKITLNTSTGDLNGDLRIPDSSKTIPVVLIIAGSGPTDKDGNQAQMPNNSLKFLAEALYSKGIATVCYDKRGIGESKSAGKAEKDMTLDDFVKDAEEWVSLLEKDKRFSEVDVLGHSEGALIGMLASQDNSDISKLISIAGPGRKLGNILREQLSNMNGMDTDSAFSYIDRLEKGEFIDNVPPQLNVLFRPSVQPFLISYFKYDPANLISKIKTPILIVQGNTDIQVSEKDAQILANANPKAKIEIIKGMNHVLKNCDTIDRQVQISTYINPKLPINEELVAVVSQFILED